MAPPGKPPDLSTTFNPPPPQRVPSPPPPPLPPPRSRTALWIVLGVLGAAIVLGVVAAATIPGITKHDHKAKRTEAAVHLRNLEMAAKMHAVETGAFPIGDTGLVPALPCCEHGSADHTCPADRSFWTDPVWERLDFFLDAPHRFQYSYRGTATGFIATAVGDLDCDGATVTYTTEGVLVDGEPTATRTTPTTSD